MGSRGGLEPARGCGVDALCWSGARGGGSACCRRRCGGWRRRRRCGGGWRRWREGLLEGAEEDGPGLVEVDIGGVPGLALLPTEMGETKIGGVVVVRGEFEDDKRGGAEGPQGGEGGGDIPVEGEHPLRHVAEDGATLAPSLGCGRGWPEVEFVFTTDAEINGGIDLEKSLETSGGGPGGPDGGQGRVDPNGFNERTFLRAGGRGAEDGGGEKEGDKMEPRHFKEVVDEGAVGIG